jgi:hypothetical protein
MMPMNPASSCYLLYMSVWLISFPCPEPDTTRLAALKTAPPGINAVSAIRKLRYLDFFLDLVRLPVISGQLSRTAKTRAAQYG